MLGGDYPHLFPDIIPRYYSHLLEELGDPTAMGAAGREWRHHPITLSPSWSWVIAGFSDTDGTDVSISGADFSCSTDSSSFSYPQGQRWLSPPFFSAWKTEGEISPDPPFPISAQWAMLPPEETQISFLLSYLEQGRCWTLSDRSILSPAVKSLPQYKFWFVFSVSRIWSRAPHPLQVWTECLKPQFITDHIYFMTEQDDAKKPFPT